MSKPSFTAVKADAGCPACGERVTVQTTLSLYEQATPGRVAVRLAPVYVVHRCPAVVPTRRRRAAK